MNGIQKEKIIAWLRPAGLVLLIIITGLLFLFYVSQRGPKEKVEEKGRPLHTLTDEEKKEILQSLSAPEGAESRYTDEEKQKILKSLSAPSSEPILSEEEKKKILESLSAPQE